MSHPNTPERFMRVAAVIPAAGSGTRLSRRLPKPYILLDGKPILIRTLKALKSSFHFSEIIVSVDFNRIDQAAALLKKGGLADVAVVAGGLSRAESVRNAVKSLRTRPDLVLIHDAARPLVSKKLIRLVLNKAAEKGAAFCATPITSTVKRAKGFHSFLLGTENRNSLFLAQTPQVFKTAWLLKRYAKAGRKALRATDEAALFDGTEYKVYMVPGEARNIKITTPEDLKWAAQTLRSRS